jgi:hypothetical protein
LTWANAASPQTNTLFNRTSFWTTETKRKWRSLQLQHQLVLGSVSSLMLGVECQLVERTDVTDYDPDYDQKEKRL